MLNEKKAVGHGLEEALPDVMMRVVSELHDVAYLIERIEPMLNALGEGAIANSADHVKVLQGIDLAVQKTRGPGGVHRYGDGRDPAILAGRRLDRAQPRQARGYAALAGERASPWPFSAVDGRGRRFRGFLAG